MTPLVHSAIRQDEKLPPWTSIPLAQVDNAAFLPSSLDIISAAPTKWLYIHSVTFFKAIKQLLLAPADSPTHGRAFFNEGRI